MPYNVGHNFKEDEDLNNVVEPTFIPMDIYENNDQHQYWCIL